MKTMPLYEINKEIEKALNDALDTETGEIVNEVALESLNKLEMQKDKKMEQICCYIKDLDALEIALNREKVSFASREQTVKRRKEWLKWYLAVNLNGEKFETSKCSVSYRRSEQVEIASMEYVPEDFLKFEEPKPDKAALKKALKAGQVFDGICLVKKQNIQIK